MTHWYELLVLRRPWLILAAVALLVALAASQLGKIRLDASADSLLLRGDPALEFFREISARYESEDFLVVTWQPDAPLFSDESLLPLRELANELRELNGVSSVVTVWDVPLLESPPVGLSRVTSDEPLPSLADPDMDRALALQEFRTSPIYADLLVSRDGDVTAIQINLERDERYLQLLRERESLRTLDERGELDAAGQQRLAEVSETFKQYSGEALERQSELVASVRATVDGYRDHAKLFVGGVPMIAADMVDFVRSDLVTFGSAIIVVMLVVLAVIFRGTRWVVIPLVTCVATVTCMLGLLAWLDWRMTVISSNFVAVLLIVTLAIAIHLVVRFRELQAETPDRDLYGLVLDTVRFMAVPCTYTAVTTIVAFVSLVVSGLQPVIDFGWMMTVGIAVALVLNFLLIPCLMLVWPESGTPYYRKGGRPFTLWFAGIADRHGRGVLWVSGFLCIAVVAGISQLRVENRFIDYFKETTEIYQGMEVLDAELGGTIPLDIILTAPDESAPLPGLEPSQASTAPVAEDDPFLEDDTFAEDDSLADDDPFAEPVDDFAAAGDPFAEEDDFFSGPGEAAAEAAFEPSFWFSLSGKEVIDSAHAAVSEREETGKTLSLATTFEVVSGLLGGEVGSVELALVQRSFPEDVATLLVDPYFDADNEQARISVRVMETSETLRRDQFLRELHDTLSQLPGLSEDRVQFTGMLVLYNNVLQSLFRSQILTLGAVFLAILAMFWMLFRSLSLALIALAPNILAAGIVLGLMGVVGIPLDIMTITIAAIVVGIGVDDCVHYVYRYLREFPKDRNYRQTMYRCHGSIGRAMYYTTITVMIGFCMLTLSNFTPSIYFGLLTVLAMAAAVVGALLLLPCLFIRWRPLGEEADA